MQKKQIIQITSLVRTLIKQSTSITRTRTLQTNPSDPTLDKATVCFLRPGFRRHGAEDVQAVTEFEVFGVPLRIATTNATTCLGSFEAVLYMYHA